jgi:signal transduction histidine kinase
MIEVSDSGPGISIHPPGKIFEPFFTTKTKGTGLGLAISRRAVQAHGGEIDLVPGSKATFRIVLPLVT